MTNSECRARTILAAALSIPKILALCVSIRRIERIRAGGNRGRLVEGVERGKVEDVERAMIEGVAVVASKDVVVGSWRERT